MCHKLLVVLGGNLGQLHLNQKTWSKADSPLYCVDEVTPDSNCTSSLGLQPWQIWGLPKLHNGVNQFLKNLFLCMWVYVKCISTCRYS